MARRPALGSHLEWHGSSIRAVVRVPPSAVKQVGSTKLKESLKTDSPKAAEALKWPAIARLKAKIREAQKITAGDPLVGEALQWKEAIAEAREKPGFHTVHDEEAGPVDGVDPVPWTVHGYGGSGQFMVQPFVFDGGEVAQRRVAA